MRLATRRDDALTGPSRSRTAGKLRIPKSEILPAANSASCWGFLMYARRFDSLDSISNLSCFLKLEFLSGLAHGRFQFGDEALALLGSHFFHGVFGLDRNGDVVAFGYRDQAHIDGPDDGL